MSPVFGLRKGSRWVRAVHPTCPIAVAAFLADCETEGRMKTGKENILGLHVGAHFFLNLSHDKGEGSVVFLHFRGLLPLRVGVAGEGAVLMPSKTYRCCVST